jgi:hypothetical protein
VEADQRFGEDRGAEARCYQAEQGGQPVRFVRHPGLNGGLFAQPEEMFVEPCSGRRAVKHQRLVAQVGDGGIEIACGERVILTQGQHHAFLYQAGRGQIGREQGLAEPADNRHLDFVLRQRVELFVAAQFLQLQLHFRVRLPEVVQRLRDFRDERRGRGKPQRQAPDFPLCARRAVCAA